KETTVEELEALSGRKRRDRLDQIRMACQAYIDGKLHIELAALAKQAMEDAGKDTASLRIVLDEDDPDRQSLLIHYPSAVEKSEYVTSSVKIESGAKSAIDPNEKKTITPYLAPDFSGGDALVINDVTTIYPQRTFLDKILILHGMTFYFEATGTLRGSGRMSRHYYDVHRLMETKVGTEACADDALVNDCVRHARMFFYRGNTGLDEAKRGSFRLRPLEKMLGPLRKDYESMATMIFREIPSFDAVLESVASAEAKLNAAR
ncbi:MAG: nucleotidyl transferase AbiEii/AbiGii toxin family protein, partial [Xanthobacteraceae bacterium]